MNKWYYNDGRIEVIYDNGLITPKYIADIKYDMPKTEYIRKSNTVIAKMEIDNGNH